MPSGDQWFQHEPERGSREHAIQTTLRNHRSDLYKITDQKERSATIDAMVQRIDEYDKLTDPIVKELGPRMQVLESQRDKLPKNDQKRVPLQKRISCRPSRVGSPSGSIFQGSSQGSG
jgi:hypothetical protein